MKALGKQRLFLVKTLLMAVLAVWLIGCAATSKMIDYGEIKTDVKMSESIFLSPADTDKTVYLQVRNTSSNQALTAGFEEVIFYELGQKGYTRVISPAEATYILQANVRYVGEVKDGMNYADTFGVASLGALTGLGISGRGSGAAAGAVAGAVLGFILDAATRVTTCIAVVEFQITERLSEIEDVTGQQVKKTEWTIESKPQGGLGTVSDPSSQTVSKKKVISDKTGVKIYNAAVAARAAQVGLNVDAAGQILIQTAGRQIAGIF